MTCQVCGVTLLTKIDPWYDLVEHLQGHQQVQTHLAPALSQAIGLLTVIILSQLAGRVTPAELEQIRQLKRQFVEWIESIPEPKTQNDETIVKQ